jgi:adenylate cyclase
VNAAGRTDLVPTPIAASHDGPEVQATILDNLLHGGMRVRAPSGVNLGFTALVAALVGLCSMAPRGKVWPHVLALLLLAGAVGAAQAAFAGGLALGLFTPLLAGVLAWLSTTALKLLTEGRYNRWLEGAFSRYLAPSVIEALKGDPSLLELGGRTREVTVLFSDVAGFTTLSEKLSPAQVSTLLNEYLTRHCDAVFAHEGVVDKYIGDAVMAFWGDPVPQADHALRACATALDVQAAMPDLEPVWRGMGLPEFKVRIGVNAGTATLGNMGSRQRFDYTALGDTVNLASRLEGANKAFGTSILIGHEVRTQAGAAILAKPLARLVVVGKAEPVQVYELVALSERADDRQRRHVEAFTHAIEAARTGRLVAARAALREAQTLASDDGACAWLEKLLTRLESGAEASPWSGVYTLSGK